MADIYKAWGEYADQNIEPAFQPALAIPELIIKRNGLDPALFDQISRLFDDRFSRAIRQTEAAALALAARRRRSGS